MLKSALIGAGDVSSVIISSVAPLALSRFLCELRGLFSCPVSITGRDITVPIKNMYRIKSEVGQDRLVNAYAAKMIYGYPAVVVDFGTAVTFDVISGSGEYLGGLIFPGIDMSLSGLYRNTALLPYVELKAVSSLIGRDTVSSIRGGILFGFGAMCDGIIGRYVKILGKRTVTVMTGGNARLIKRYSKSIRNLDEDITLKGLYLVAKSAKKGVHA